MELRLHRNGADHPVRALGDGPPKLAEPAQLGRIQTSLPGEQEQSRRLRRLLFWLAVFFPFFALLDLYLRWRLGVPGLQFAALFAASVLISVLVATRLNARGRTSAAAQVVAYSILLLCVLDAWVAPSLYVEMTMGSLLSVIVALPYVYAARLRWLLRAALVATCWTAAAGFWPRLQLPLGEHQGEAFLHFTGIVAGSFLALIAIGHFSDRLRDLLRREERAHAQTLAGEQRARFLASVSAALSETLDVGEVLERAARYAVEGVADWCTISLLAEDGSMERIGAAHRADSKRLLVEQYTGAFPLSNHGTTQLAEVIRTGRSTLVENVSAGTLAYLAQSDRHLEVLRELGVGSFILAPLRAHGKVLGVIALVRESASNPFRNEDVSTAEDLGVRAGLALENATLFERVRKAVQVRESFLGIAGHELKTPLSALKLQLQLLAGFANKEGVESLPSRDVKARVDRIQRSLERMQRLVADLLDVSQISSGRLSLTYEDVDLAALAQDVASMFAAQAQISVRGETTLVGSWDRIRLEQVLMNLIANGIKYGRDKPIEITIDSTDDDAIIQVRDHGIGIAPQDQARIFERFERAVSNVNYGGLGLGLWVSRELVRAHGGTIEVRSQVGEGSTFVVRLPKHRG